MGAHALEQVERTHGVDFQVLAIVEGGHEGRGQVVDRVNALDRTAYIVQVAQIAGDRFNAGAGVQLVGAAGVAWVDEGSNLVACGQQTGDQIGANPACAAGYQNLHCTTFLQAVTDDVGMVFSVSERSERV